MTIIRSPRLPASGEGMFIHCYAPFGGKDGSRLSSLVRMTALLDSAAGLYGMSFSYTDGSEFLCGLNTTTHELGQSIPCIEQSFFINGPEGERITRLGYTTAASPHVGYRCIVMIEVRLECIFTTTYRLTIRFSHNSTATTYFVGSTVRVTTIPNRQLSISHTIKHLMR